jgi:hypothetical protein
MARTAFEERLGQIIRMLGSSVEGERVNAASRLIVVLQGGGKDIHWLADRVEGEEIQQQNIDAYWQGRTDERQQLETEKQVSDGTHNADGSLTWHGKVRFCMNALNRLNAWEQEFIQNQAIKTSDPTRVPTEKEQIKIKQIYFRCGGVP